jgi:hypothetical protein
VVKDFGPTVSIGVSAESPQVVFQSPGSTVPFGMTINSANQGQGSGLMDTVTSYSLDKVPDFVEKVAFDPGWGHYEVLGVERFFIDRSQFCSNPAAACSGASIPIGTGTNHNTTGWGVGGSVLLPVIPTFLDVQGSVLYGKGIGRYGSGQLPDVTFARDGSLSAITALQALVGATAHVTPATDIYVYAGLERADSNFSVAPNNIGYGNPNYSNIDCGLENFGGPFSPAPGSSVVGASESNSTCSVNTKQVTEITVGFWHNFYKGDYGRIAGGAQFEYLHRDVFNTTTGAPPVNEAVAMTSLRYYFP